MDTAAAGWSERRIQPTSSTAANRPENQTAGWDPEGQIPLEILRQFRNHARVLTRDFDEIRREN